MINWVILIFMTMFGALGGYFFKKATSQGIVIAKNVYDQSFYRRNSLCRQCIIKYSIIN